MSSTPYLDKLIKTLETTKELVRLHEQKIIIALLEPFDKVAYENIEIKISCLKSEGEINTLKKVILEKEDYFKNYYTIWEKDSIEMKDNFENVLTKCKELAETNDNLKNTLNNIDFTQIELNKEAKVYIYKRLKGLL
jgi:hypothetical protein